MSEPKKPKWRALLSGAVALGGLYFVVRGEPVFGVGLMAGGAGVTLLSAAEIRSREGRPDVTASRWKLGGGLLAAAGVLLLLVDFFVAP